MLVESLGTGEPADRRLGVAVSGTRDDHLGSLVRRLGEDVIAVGVGAELGRENRAAARDQRLVEQVVFLGPRGDQEAGLQGSALHRDGDPFDRGRLVEEGPLLERGDVAVSDEERGARLLRVQRRQGRVESLRLGDARGRRPSRHPRECVDHVHELAAAVDRGLEVRPFDAQSPRVLLHPDVGDPGAGGAFLRDGLERGDRCGAGPLAPEKLSHDVAGRGLRDFGQGLSGRRFVDTSLRGVDVRRLFLLRGERRRRESETEREQCENSAH